jgi:hypothetical protein
MSEKKKPEDEKVVYFPGKPGFYKKGPGEFKMSLGDLDDLVDEVESDEDPEPPDAAG